MGYSHEESRDGPDPDQGQEELRPSTWRPSDGSPELLWRAGCGEGERQMGSRSIGQSHYGSFLIIRPKVEEATDNNA